MSLLLDIRTSYGVLLWHFVDSLSKWDYFVSDHILEYYKQNWDFNDEDKRHLDEYAEIRKKFGWSRETGLFSWANANFPEHPDYSALLPHVRYFKSRKNKNSKSLEDNTNEALIKVLGAKSQVAEKLKDLPLEKIVDYITKLIEYYPEIVGPIECYLAYTPTGSYQGGASGRGIYTEVPLGRENYINSIPETITHEYLHKIVKMGNYFKSHSNETIRQNTEKQYPHLFEGQETVGGFLEEVLVYTTVNVILFKDSPDEMIERYSKKDSGAHEYVFLWQIIKEMKPVLDSYFENKTDVLETRKELDRIILLSTRGPAGKDASRK